MDPISVFYPAVKDLQDQGYPIAAPKMSTAQLEANARNCGRDIRVQ